MCQIWWLTGDMCRLKMNSDVLSDDNQFIFENFQSNVNWKKLIQISSLKAFLYSIELPKGEDELQNSTRCCSCC